jgi:hypothetical protein
MGTFRHTPTFRLILPFHLIAFLVVFALLVFNVYVWGHLSRLW